MGNRAPELAQAGRGRVRGRNGRRARVSPHAPGALGTRTIARRLGVRPDARDAAPARMARARRTPRPAARAFAGAQCLARAARRPQARAFQSSTRCAPSGRTPPWITARIARGGLRYRLSRALETAAFRRADAITTICEGLRAEIVARSIAADKVTVIPNAVDIDRFPVLARRDPELEARWGLAGHDVVGFCGSFYAYEGLDLLVRALPAIAARRPAVRLLLVGGGAQEAQLRALAQKLGLAQRVVFAGRVPNAQIDRYYSLIDVLAFPRQRDPTDRARDAAQAARGDGAGSRGGRVRRWRAPRADPRRRDRPAAPRGRRRRARWRGAAACCRTSRFAPA